MVKHVLYVPREVKPDTLEWKLRPDVPGSITLVCRELGDENESGWNSVVTVGTDGKLYQHEYIHTNLLHLTETRAAQMVVPRKPSWNTNVEELKNHYGKLVTLVLKDGGSLGRARHGILSAALSTKEGCWTITGATHLQPITYNGTNIEKFCVHELPEEN